jgi:hypothetical protein
MSVTKLACGYRCGIFHLFLHKDLTFEYLSRSGKVPSISG